MRILDLSSLIVCTTAGGAVIEGYAPAASSQTPELIPSWGRRRAPRRSSARLCLHCPSASPWPTRGAGTVAPGRASLGRALAIALGRLGPHVVAAELE